MALQQNKRKLSRHQALEVIYLNPFLPNAQGALGMNGLKASIAVVAKSPE